MTRTIHTEILTGRDVVTGLELAYPVAWEERPIRSCPRCGQDLPADPGCPAILNTGAGLGGQIEPVSLQHGCGEWLGIAWTEGYDGQDPAELAARFRAALAAEDAGDDDGEAPRAFTPPHGGTCPCDGCNPDGEPDDDPDPEPFVRGKWTMDGAATLEEAAGRLEAAAANLRGLAAAGWTLREPVADDYGWLVQP